MYKPKMGARKGQAPAITVPNTENQVTYLNIPLVDFFQAKGIDRLSVFIDPEKQEIVLKPAKEGEKSYKIISTGRRGFGISPKLRKWLPAGRYVLGDKRRMVFEKAV